MQVGISAVYYKLRDLVGRGGKSAADEGTDSRDYRAAALGELKGGELAGGDGSCAGMGAAGCKKKKELTQL